MIGDIGCFIWHNVSNNLVLVLEICKIGFLGPLVPLASEDASSSNTFEALPHSADASEKVDKSETSGRGLFLSARQHLAKCGLQIDRTIRLSAFPSSHCLGRDLEMLPNLTLSEALPYLRQKD